MLRSMNVDLRGYEEVSCSDCNSPIVFSLLPGEATALKLDGCRCGREHLNLPDGVVFGLAPGPLFLYKLK